MHRHGLAITSILGCFLFGLAGCALDAPRPLLVRSIYVEEAVGAPSPDLGRCADTIHDTSVRVLKERGFIAAMEPTEADAWLRATWSIRPSAIGTPEGRVTLRMSLVSRDGTLLKGADIIADAPAGLLTNERIADLVRARLGAVLR